MGQGVVRAQFRHHSSNKPEGFEGFVGEDWPFIIEAAGERKEAVVYGKRAK